MVRPEFHRNEPATHACARTHASPPTHAHTRARSRTHKTPRVPFARMVRRKLHPSPSPQTNTAPRTPRPPTHPPTHPPTKPTHPHTHTHLNTHLIQANMLTNRPFHPNSDQKRCSHTLAIVPLAYANAHLQRREDARRAHDNGVSRAGPGANTAIVTTTPPPMHGGKCDISINI